MLKKLALITASIISVSTFADEEQAKFNQYVADLKAEAIEKGYKNQLLKMPLLLSNLKRK